MTTWGGVMTSSDNRVQLFSLCLLSLMVFFLSLSLSFPSPCLPLAPSPSAPLPLLLPHSDIVRGNRPAIIKLLEFIREKFDFEFIFEKIVEEVSKKEGEREEVERRKRDKGKSRKSHMKQRYSRFY